jgi:O-succinylbenzoic acid--CoA ligase
MIKAWLESDVPWLAARALDDGDAPALREDGVISFAELALESDRLARSLRNQGVDTGSRVAVLAAPSRRFVALLFAVQRIGAVFVPLGLRLTDREIAAQLALVSPTLLVVDSARETRARIAMACLPELARVGVVRVGDLDMLPGWTGRLRHDVDPQAAFTILFTSGTAATPKAVVLTGANHHASASAVLAHLRVSGGDTWLCALPLSHVGGLSILMRGIIAGFPVVLHPVFLADRVADSLTRGEASFISLVPTMLARVLDAGAGRRPRAVRAVVSGGAALAPALARRAADAGYPVVSTYGLTETASQVTSTELGAETEIGSSGRALRGVELRVCEPDQHGIGEILVRAPQVMAGYWNDEAATASSLEGGWLRTGDAGRLTANASLIVVDRRADLIVTGGENVAPAEIEALLLEHPGIADAGVYGASDDVWGTSVCAAVVAKKGTALDPGALSAWCRERMAGFKTPRHFAFVASLPRTASGKLRRGELARSGAAQLSNHNRNEP